jgi:hypothetical protein
MIGITVRAGNSSNFGIFNHRAMIFSFPEVSDAIREPNGIEIEIIDE